jgi:hypothetical protein
VNRADNLDVPDGSEENGKHPTDEDRERYLRLLDNARDRGLLDVEEHARRVLDVGVATSFDDLNEIVWQLPVMERPTDKRPSRAAPLRQRRQPEAGPLPALDPLAAQQGTSAVIEDVSSVPVTPVIADPSSLTGAGLEGMRMLDPVDVAMLQMRRSAKKSAPSRRWGALVAVGLVFLVLIVLGVILAAHTHTTSGGGGSLGNPRAPHSAPARFS